MDVAIVYESIYGNTRLAAEAIAAGVREADPAAEVSLFPVAEATPEKIADAKLVLVGGPTHMLGMTRPSSRDKAKTTGDGVRAVATLGIREWLDRLPHVAHGHGAAAFDTRLPHPLAGGAARSIERGLRRHGYEIVLKPQGFVVEDAQGPLRAGEQEKAKAWGARAVQQLLHQPAH